MKLTLIKIIAFLATFMFVQGIILPWTISNNYLPLWADIVLIALIMMMWGVIIDRIARRLIDRFKDDTDEI